MPKIKELKQIHGRFDPQTPYFDVLDKIEAKLNNLRSKVDDGEKDLDKYTKKLNKINLHDLQIYATNVGIVPTDNKDRLIRALIKEYIIHHS